MSLERLTDEQRAEFRAWLLERPEAHELILAWPPNCKVMAKAGVTLLVPAPGIVGYVVSYYTPTEAGGELMVGVAAPMQVNVYSEITDVAVRSGEWLTGQCKPDQLDFLEHDVITPEDIRGLIDG